MEYAIGYYSDDVEKDILALPDTLAARYRLGTAHGGGGSESWGTTHKVDGRWLA